MLKMMTDIQFESMTEVNSVQETFPDHTERPINHPSVCCTCSVASGQEVSPTTFKGLDS